jgi:acetyltransferase-like isoleucine patch superfamily enzyme
MRIIKLLIRNSLKFYVYIRESIIKAIINRINFYIHEIRYVRFPITQGIIRIYNKGTIELGKNVHITSASIANPLGANENCYLITKSGAKIKIDDNTGISNTIIYAFKYVNIGKNVFIGGGCKIYDSDFHSLILKKRLKMPDDDIISKEINIHDGVFIGAHSIILKGVTIHKNSVIGAGSIVTQDIPPDEIWAGNPAKFIKKLPQ